MTFLSSGPDLYPNSQHTWIQSTNNNYYTTQSNSHANYVKQNSLPYIDITLYKGDRFDRNQILDVRTQIKPTNKLLYIHASSYHPPTTINAISKGKVNRYLRTNSDEREFRNMKQKLTNRLLQRGYKHKQILPHINAIKFNQRHQILFKRKPKKNKRNWSLSHNLFCDDAQRLKQILTGN